MASATNLLVFRDTAEQLCGRSLLLRLLQKLREVDPSRPASVLSPLILAGQLECTLADSDSPSTGTAAAISDALAAAFLGTASVGLGALGSQLSSIEGSLPGLARVSYPEGFAYYALHPVDFAEAAAQCVHAPSVGLIGIRSIGTTLSAVAAARLIGKGVFASRITVRPAGHPYDRKTEFTNSQTSWLEQLKRKDSVFLIVDEGPGLSGSSFLSVAEALERHGVSPSRITLVGTRDTDPAQLCTRDAVRRWGRYKRQKAVSTIARGHLGDIHLSGGEWRNVCLQPGVEWPACWPEMEALKFLYPDRQYLFKFQGFGEHGERAFNRAQALFEAGWTPRPIPTSEGMGCYPFVSGSPLSSSDLSAELLDRIAEYCAFRASSFPARIQDDQLMEMVRFNLLQELKLEVDLPAGCFDSPTPIIADCRMAPHEWIRSKDGRIIKLDAACDGEGHFLPGPTDILWDMAGAIIEWKMDAEAEAYLVRQSQKRGVAVSQTKLAGFLLAYSVFRLSYCKMALSSTQKLSERARLQSAVSYYECVVKTALHRLPFSQRPLTT